MAYRKVGGTKKRRKPSKAKTAPRRRPARRVSGVNSMSGMLMKVAGLVLGSVGARELNTLIVRFAPTFSPLMSGIAQMAAGYFLPKLVKGPFWSDVGDGMIANGGMVTIVSTGLISGLGNSDRMAYRINGGMAGTGNFNVVNGTGYMPVVSGAFPSPAFQTIAGGTPGFSVVNGPQTRVTNNPMGPASQPKFGTYY